MKMIGLIAFALVLTAASAAQARPDARQMKN
jgi:hypothetical protein